MKKEDTTMDIDRDYPNQKEMTEAEIHAAALADPDCQPLTPEQLANMKRIPRIKIVRRVLRLSQEEFSNRYCIPVGTLRDWEQGRYEPDAAGRAYLHVIANEPEMVRRILEGPVTRPARPKPS
jgi:putative transcriptional regulator